MTETARGRRWAERRANRLNARRLADLPLFEHTPALELVAPTVTTDAMVVWERERVEATNRREAEQRRYWEDRYWGLMADAADYLPDYERQIMEEMLTITKRPPLDPNSPGYCGQLAYRCDDLNNRLCAAEAPGYYEHRSPEIRESCKRGRARTIETFFFIAAQHANRENKEAA